MAAIVSTELDHVIQDLSVRFLNNLPLSEFESFERLFFTIEEAHWFYLDFIRAKNLSLPKLQLKAFARLMFEHNALLSPYCNDVERLVKDYQSYKHEVPTCGAAMLNPEMDQVVLVKGWGNTARWGFPKGKMGRAESEEQAAIREVLEETGFDVSRYIIPNEYLDSMSKGRRNRIFIATNVPMDAHFETRTRKEISKIEWKPLNSLPDTPYREKQTRYSSDTNYAGVVPYVRRLVAWVNKRKKEQSQNQRTIEIKQTPLKTSKNTNYSKPTPSSETNGHHRALKQEPNSEPIAASRHRRNKDNSTFGESSARMTTAERDDFFQQYVKAAEKRALELGVDDDDWPVPILNSRDLDQKAREKSEKLSKYSSQNNRRKHKSLPNVKSTPRGNKQERVSGDSNVSSRSSRPETKQTQNLRPSTTETKGNMSPLSRSQRTAAAPLRQDDTCSRKDMSGKPLDVVRPIRLLKRPPQPELKQRGSREASKSTIISQRQSALARQPLHPTSSTAARHPQRDFSFNRIPILRCLT